MVFTCFSVLTWINGDTGKGISLQYPNIALHAISRDTTVHSKECLYVMVDSQVEFQGTCNYLLKLDYD